MTMKETLQGLIEAARARESEILVPRIGDPPPAPDAWAPKDVLSHLSAWRSIAASELDALRTGGSPPQIVDELDEHNAKIYAETHDLPPEVVLDEADRSWDELMASLEACTEEDLMKGRPRRPEQESWQIVPGNTYFHLAQHLDWWWSDQGDDAEAEAAARWAHDLAVEAFPEDNRRGVAEYNLGCHYASHGRAEEALPYLRLGIELFPPLVEFARVDTDLDPIRSLPEMAELLA